MLEDLWEQNGLLLKTIEDLEETANRQMQKMHRRLEQQQALASIGTNRILEQVPTYIYLPTFL